MITQILLAAAPFKASGGTVTVSGGYTYHTFTSSGTFTVESGSKAIDYFMIGGGGAGCGAGATFYTAGGGGAAEDITTTDYLIGSGIYTIDVGAGGIGTTSVGVDGDPSTITLSGNIIATARGGKGGNASKGGDCGSTLFSGGPYTGGNQAGAGGAGSRGNGGANSGNTGGNGGVGFTTTFTGSAMTVCGGGAGAGHNPGSGQSGGGGAQRTGNGGNATTYGSGGGGGRDGSGYRGGHGMQGIVVIRYINS